MICPICGKEGGREWKHCRKDKVVVCSDCCISCGYYVSSSLGGLMCGYDGNKLTAEEIKELNLIRMRIEKTRKVLEIKKNLGWPYEDMEAQLKYLNERKAEIEER